VEIPVDAFHLQPIFLDGFQVFAARNEGHIVALLCQQATVIPTHSPRPHDRDFHIPLLSLCHCEEPA
jgi:hypothetical protein